MAQVKAPWTQEQVAALNRYQTKGTMHPFTCAWAGPRHVGNVLVATENGWVCPFCNYTQDWCHDFMLRF